MKKPKISKTKLATTHPLKNLGPHAFAPRRKNAAKRIAASMKKMPKGY